MKIEIWRGLGGSEGDPRALSEEPSPNTMKSSQSTREEKYGENGRILHNLAFVWSKSVKIEHGPAISIDCLDLSLK